MPGVYGYDVGIESAVATVARALASGISFMDTSNNYGDGESERRIGKAIELAGGLPEGFTLASKADPMRARKSFTGERVLTSFEESAARLGLEHLPLFYLHDPELFDFDSLTRPGGAVDAMVELKRRGSVGMIGVAGGHIDTMRRYVDLGVFEVLLNHNQYTLLDRSASVLIDHAISAGMAFVNAAPYASGMLAKPISARPRYQYREPTAAILRRTEQLRSICARSGIPLAAAALQFSTRDPRITSTVVGVSAPERVDELLQNYRIPIPDELWSELDAS